MVILLPVRLESLSMMEYPTETILSRGLLGVCSIRCRDSHRFSG